MDAIKTGSGAAAAGAAGTERAKRDGALVFGGVAALLVAALSLADVVVGTMTGGNLEALPRSAAERFAQLATSPLLGLYKLDLLNLVTTLLFLPALHAVYVALRGQGSKLAGLGWGLALAGAAVFAAGNPALPMLGLSRDYLATTDVAARQALAAAGEAILARGAHGGPGVFTSFLLPLLANLLLSLSMLKGRRFPPALAWLGLGGNALLAAYLVLVTFVPGVAAVATAAAAPGGLMSIAWMVMLGIRFVSHRGNTVRTCSAER
ncbi:MAG: DUF4386 family protein [Spirochaetia bacterium]|nr:DUF4386 family protein [Spirochaetia bacterium]